LIERKDRPDKCPTKGCKSQTGGIPHPNRQTKKNEPIFIHTKAHIHMMAKRYAGKIFLEHLWIAWREIEGLPVTMPWVFERGGHRDYITADGVTHQVNQS